MKKLISVIICAASAAMPVCAEAAAETAQSACVINAATGDIVFEKNAEERLPMASTTKIMTAYVALKNSTPKDIVNVSMNAQQQEGSAMYISAGEQFYMEDVLYGLMLNSGNDAAVAIAEHISGDVGSFVDLMNKAAWEIGADNTMFCNPNGLPNPAHRTTAKDLANITRKAMQIPEFRRIVSTASRTVWQAPRTTEAGTEVLPKAYELYNHNKLLNMYDGAVGVKTGYTETAGRCLVSAAERDGMVFIAVTLNDNDDWNTHAQLLDQAFAQHHPARLASKGEVIKEFVLDGKKYTFSAAEDCVIPLRDNAKNHINADIHISSNLPAPVNKGEKVGYVEYKCGGELFASVDIVSDEDITSVGKYRLKNSFYEIWKNVWDFFLI